MVSAVVTSALLLSTVAVTKRDAMNTQLVNSLVQAIYALSIEERAVLEEKLFFESGEPSTPDLATLAIAESSFDFLSNEPDIYSLRDGEPIDATQ